MEFLNKTVAAKFEAYPVEHRNNMLALRKLIFEVAASIECVGEIEETLKWGEPAYLTSECKSGTTIRIDWKDKAPNKYAIYFNCQTDLVARFRTQFANNFEFDGDRGILLPVDQPMPVAEIAKCISAALTYHADKKR